MELGGVLYSVGGENGAEALPRKRLGALSFLLDGCGDDVDSDVEWAADVVSGAVGF